jgi:LSD1 subclass zinc finger protein
VREVGSGCPRRLGKADVDGFMKEGGMQTFTCPECGHEGTYDPWIESAHCPQCGYTPPEGVRIRAQHPRKRTDTHQPFLDELLSHWNGTHVPDPTFTLPTSELAIAFFQDYQRALGEDPLLGAGDHLRYVRNYHPQRREILPFAGAYLLLRHGERATAARHLCALTTRFPKFVDAWVWLSATTDDPAERIEYLENAVAQEPAHPLARDALAIARGRVSLTGARRFQSQSQAVTVIKCPQCGGSLHYEPGATEVTCPYCDYHLDVRGINLLEEQARLIGDLRLQRRYQSCNWAEVQRIVRCQSCGAELTMTHHLARQCTFCGSTSVLTEDNRRTFEQPDGFLPFTMDEQQAAAAVHKAQHSGLRGLKAWLTGREQKPAELQPVYMPFWVFDGFIEVRAWTTGGVDQTAPLGGAALGADVMMFDNLPFSAVDVPTPALLRRIFPFELSALVPYESRLLADWPAALYNRDVEVVVEDAYDVMIALARQRVRPLVLPESPDYAHVHRSFQVTSTTYQLVLLPVWVALVQSRDKHSVALVNDQTGKVAFGPSLPGDSQRGVCP